VKPYPEWLHVLSWIVLSAGFLSALIIVVDVIRRPQKMGIMNLVWPITGLYWGPVAVWAYMRVGRQATKAHHEEMMRHRPEQTKRSKEAMKSRPPTTTQVAVAVSHCGAGCTLGDIVGEWWIAAMGLTFAGGLFETRLLVDFLLAWAFGVAFQYFTIVPVRGLPAAGRHGRHQGGHHLHPGVSDRHVYLDGVNVFRFLSRLTSAAQRSCVLVHDADCNDRRIFHILSGQHVAAEERAEGEDAGVRRRRSATRHSRSGVKLPALVGSCCTLLTRNVSDHAAVCLLAPAAFDSFVVRFGPSRNMTKRNEPSTSMVTSPERLNTRLTIRSYLPVTALYLQQNSSI
jgi:hypothetical protein